MSAEEHPRSGEGFAEALRHLDECITAIIDCKKEAQEATLYAMQSELYYEECRYWADKFRRRRLLIGGL